MSESSNVNEPSHFLKTFRSNKATILKFLNFIFLLDPISALLINHTSFEGVFYIVLCIPSYNLNYIYFCFFDDPKQYA